MKKFLNVLKKVLLGLLVLVLIILIGGATYNVIATNNEKKKIVDYGQKVTVDGKSMNVYIEGDGPETIVLLPGYGTPAPTLDFLPMIHELAAHYRVVSVEPFGYGLSDPTSTPRTKENIVREVHEALQQLNIDSFVLMGHSIAGIYGLNYVNTYPNEVTAFVGIDTSTPYQPMFNLPKFPFQFLKKTGLMRLGTPKNLDKVMAPNGTDEATREQIYYITMRNSIGDTTLDESSRFTDNFERSQGLTFPSTLPIYLFVQEFNPSNDQWVALHEDQIKDSTYRKLTLIDADHYLHHTHSKQIAELTHEFLSSMKEQ